MILKSFLVVFYLFIHVCGLRFDIVAKSKADPFCIRDFVQQGELVVLTINTDGHVGDGQELSVSVHDSQGNQYREKKGIAGMNQIAFTSLGSISSAFDVCFVNVLQYNRGGLGLKRSIELDIESGSEARDWNLMATEEKLKPIEVELRKIEELTDEIVDELFVLKMREEGLRDTNESTNDRVKYFTIVILVALVGVGMYQVYYMRHFFKVKHII